MSTTQKRSVDRATILVLAAKVGCDPRTARKILEGGANAVRNVVHRERAQSALLELGPERGAA